MKINPNKFSIDQRIKIMDGLEINYRKKLCSKLNLNFLKKCKRAKIEND